MNLNEITIGMTPQEKEIYFAALHRNTIDELNKLEVEKKRRHDYKNSMITDILRFSDLWSKDQLEKKDISTLERIYDYC